MNLLNNVLPLVNKIKADKKLVLFIFIGVLLIVIIFISELDFNSEEITDTNEISDEEYCSILEAKVKYFVENIEGAGRTEVIITLAETTEYIYATDDKTVKKNNSNSNDQTVEKDFVIIEDNSNDTGLLIKKIEPKIRGVAISCEGGDNATVQEQIYSSIEAVLDVKSSNISISKLALKENKDEK